MNGLAKKLAALTHWVLHTRQHVSRVEDEAETLLAQLSCLSARARRIDALAHQPLSVGLYGHASASKIGLLKTLLNSADGALWLRSGERKLDYFAHVHPGWHQSAIAVRFTAQPQPFTSGAPLLLTLYRESEFARRLTDQASLRTPPAEVCSRLDALQAQAMPQPQPGMSANEAMEMLAACQRNAPPASLLSAELLLEMAELLPRLRREDRAQLLATLWGEDATLTAAWLRHARLSEQLSGATQILASDALLLSDAMCLAGRSLADAPPDDPGDLRETAVFPLRDGQPQRAQRVSVADLARACQEITLQLDKPGSCPVDLVTLPVGRLGDYGERLLPDTLLICQAARTPEEAQLAAQQLAGWLSRTDTGSATPRLVWALTAEDIASRSRRQIDDKVQRALMRADVPWGVFQLFEGEHARQASAWLKETVNDAQRQQRYRALLQACAQQTEALFSAFLPLTAAQRAAREQQIKQLIQHLQQQIDRHGDLLTALELPAGLLTQTHRLFRQKQPVSPAAGVPVIDLFADSPDTDQQTEHAQPDLAASIYKAWVHYLRQLTPEHPRLKPLMMPSSALRLTTDLLIKIAEHCELRARLRARLAECKGCDEAEMACAAATISEFATWLGYAETPSENRPRSKVDAAKAIFAAAQQTDSRQRLTQLDTQPLSQGLHWAYDWLVAFYHRIQEVHNEADALTSEQAHSLRAAWQMEKDTTALAQEA